MNNFKVALRILWRNKGFSFINIFGFSIALTLVLLIYLLITNELSFDKHQKNAERIYRIVVENNRGNFKSFDISPPFPLHEKLKENVPGIEKVSQIYCSSYTNIYSEHKAFTESGITFVDSSFFNFFSVDFISGNGDVVMDAGKALITEKLAKKLYGESNPIGKIIRINEILDVEVRGVVESPPANTHLQYKILLGLENLSEDFVNFNYDAWGSMKSGFSTYILKDQNTSEESVNKSVNQVYLRYANPRNENESRFFLEPLNEIHISYYGELPGSYSTPKPVLWTFGSIGLFILIMATINFVNLSTIQSIRRSKEVGLRKVFGSSRAKLIKQFLLEALILIAVAESIALIITEISLPTVNSMLANTMKLSLYNQNYIILFLLTILLITSLLSGVYPAYNISSYNPIRALRTKLTFNSNKKFSLYKTFVIFQFFLAQLFLLGLIILFSQLKFIQKQDVGFNTDDIALLEMPEISTTAIENFKNKILQFPEVTAASCQFAPPLYNNVRTSNFSIPGNSEKYFANIKAVDEHYRDVYDLKLLSGNWLNRAVAEDTIKQSIVNETFIERTGYESPTDAIGELFYHNNATHQIMGVVEDFSLYTAHRVTSPVILFYQPSEFFQIGVRYAAGSDKIVIPKIEKIWQETFPESAISYEHYNQSIEYSYRTERVMISLLGGLGFIAIIISLLGFFGLINFIINNKYKEIAVRKTYGANTGQIIRFLLRKFIRLIIIASFFSGPLGYFILSKWLQMYAYRINLGIQYYLISTAVIIILATLSIIYQTWNASRINPAKVLRYE